MKKHITVVTCDRCKKEDVPGTQSIRVEVGSQTDAAGGSSEAVYQEIDLCPTCLAIALKRYLKDLLNSQRRAWLHNLNLMSTTSYQENL